MADEKFVRRREEKFFFELFHQVLELMKEGRASDKEVACGIERAIDSFRVGPEGACAVSNFQTYGDLLGYFYWSSPLSAGVTRHKTLYALEYCDEFKSCFNQPSLKIASIGGGTGSDLVGLYSALYEYSEFQNLEILLVDNNPNWKPFLPKVEELLHEYDFGNASRLVKSRNISTSFICADMRNRLPDDLRIKLGNSLIIWMKGVQSTLNYFERLDIIKNVISSMTEGGLLVILDSQYYNSIFDNFSHRLERVYSTGEGSSYILEPFPGYDDKLRFCRQTNQEISIFTVTPENVALNNQN